MKVCEQYLTYNVDAENPFLYLGTIVRAILYVCLRWCVCVCVCVLNEVDVAIITLCVCVC